MSKTCAKEMDLHVGAGYRDYLAAEWELFAADRSRYDAALDATAAINVNRVLDIGCGAGQELLPFVERGATGFGIDPRISACQVASEMFRGVELFDRVAFLCASGANLPFSDEAFDVVICRVAIMYMDNRAALSEIHRVLRPAGKFFVKYHAPAFYWAKLWDGFRKGDLRSAVHAGRVLYAGYSYYFTGRQPFNALTAGGEIFQTKRTLMKEVSKFGWKIEATLPDTNAKTPSLVLSRC